MTRPKPRGVRLDHHLLYRTVKSVAAFRGVALSQVAEEADVPLSTLKKMSPGRAESFPPTADNLLRLIIWLDPEHDLAQYATEPKEDDDRL